MRINIRIMGRRCLGYRSGFRACPLLRFGGGDLPDDRLAEPRIARSILAGMSRRGRKAFQEPKQQRTREQLARILLVADQLFAEHGYEGTRLADIAAAVPCSMSTIDDRFASKEELLRYMHRQGTEEAIAMIDQIEPPDASDMDLRIVLPTAVQIGLSLIERFRGRRRAVAARGPQADAMFGNIGSRHRWAVSGAAARWFSVTK